MAKVNTVTRETAKTLDMVHIVLGVVIIVMAVMAFINPDENMVLFPLIFMAAATLKIMCGIAVIRNVGSDHDRKIRFRGFLQILAGVVILGIGIVSAVSIWF